MALTQSSSWFEQNAPDWARESATFIGNIWNDGAYGLTYGEITIAVVIIMIALMIRGLFARLIVKTIMRLASGTKSGFDLDLTRAISDAVDVKGNQVHFSGKYQHDLDLSFLSPKSLLASSISSLITSTR